MIRAYDILIHPTYNVSLGNWGGLAGSAIAPDMAAKRLEALQKIRELNALRKSQRGDLNMY